MKEMKERKVNEKKYFCAFCGRYHKPYVGLKYTEHLKYKINNKKAWEVARSIFLDILDSKERKLTIVVTRDELISLITIFDKMNLPINFIQEKDSTYFRAFNK
jgi:hypothetical protein